MLTRDQILGLEDSKKVEVKIPEWGGSVFIKTMSSLERDSFELDFTENKKANFRAKLAVKTVCDENGELLFTEKDALELGRKNAAAMSRIFNEASKLNNFSNEDIEELEKN